MMMMMMIKLSLQVGREEKKEAELYTKHCSSVAQRGWFDLLQLSQEAASNETGIAPTKGKDQDKKAKEKRKLVRVQGGREWVRVV
eukprot:scaffold197833_cov18-Tisochrysis_lutea.AAC.1